MWSIIARTFVPIPSRTPAVAPTCCRASRINIMRAPTGVMDKLAIRVQTGIPLPRAPSRLHAEQRGINGLGRIFESDPLATAAGRRTIHSANADDRRLQGRRKMISQQTIRRRLWKTRFAQNTPIPAISLTPWPWPHIQPKRSGRALPRSVGPRQG